MTERWTFGGGSSRDEVVKLSASSPPQKQGIQLSSAIMIGASDYEKLKNLPTFNGSPIIGDYLLGEGLSIEDKVLSVADGIVKRVRIASTAQWAVEPSYVPPYGQVIIYTDYATVDGVNYAGFKVGDGLAPVVDLPFVGGEMRDVLGSHIADAQAHVSAEDRAYWNSKHRVLETVTDEILQITF